MSAKAPAFSDLILDVAREGDPKTLQEMAKQVKLDGLCDSMDAMEVNTR